MRGLTRTGALLRGGTGELVVLLHGLAGSARELAPLAGALVDGGYRVVVPDQLGHGHRGRRPADVSRRAYVDDVLALLDEPAWLVGQSMGAHTAMLAAAAAPDRVRGLVMIEGGVGGSADDYPERLRRFFAGWPVPFADAAAARSFLGDTPIARAWVADLERRDDGLWPRFDADVMAEAIRGVAASARWPQWQGLTAPTMIVEGEHGTLAADEVRRMRALRPSVRHEVVAGAGHDVHLDDPATTARLVLGFLRGRRP